MEKYLTENKKLFDNQYYNKKQYRLKLLIKDNNIKPWLTFKPPLKVKKTHNPIIYFIDKSIEQHSKIQNQNYVSPNSITVLEKEYAYLSFQNKNFKDGRKELIENKLLEQIRKHKQSVKI